MNLLDICVILIVLLFSILALVRGFVKELFGKVCIIGAIALSIFLSPLLTSYIIKVIKNEVISLVLAYLLIFIASFLLLRIIQYILEKVFTLEILTSLNKALGLLLGFFEGIIVALLFLLILKAQHFIDLSALLEKSFAFRLAAPFINYSTSYIKTLPNA